MAGNVLGCWVFDICQNSLKLSFSSQTANIFSWIMKMPYTQSINIDLRHLPSSAFFVLFQTWNEPDHPKPLPQTLQKEQQQGQSCSGTRVATWCQPPSWHPATSLWEEEFSWHEVGIRVQLAGLLCTSFFPKWSLTARAACIKLACVGSAFLLMHGWRTRSNQIQH